MEDKHYYYAVTRVHNNELNLLSNDDIKHLQNLSSLDECFSFLKNKGWGDSNSSVLDVQALVSDEKNKIWSLMEELIGEIEPFDIFKYRNDFNNLKAAIKINYSKMQDVDIERYFVPYGLVKIDLILEAARTNNFELLPAPLNTLGQKASKSLIHTDSGQSCDIIIDNSFLETIFEIGVKAKSELLKQYVTLIVDIANIKIAIRGSHMEKSQDFFELALADAGSLSKHQLTIAASKSTEAVYEYLNVTDYSGAVIRLENSMASFEAWCDNKLMETIKPQRNEIEGLDPLLAFVLARENEINMVKLILSSKINELNTEKVEDRMREMYV